MLPFLFLRFLEPSSYAGIGITYAAVNGMVQHGPTLAGIGGALAGIAAFLVPEGASAAPSSQAKN